MGRKLLPVLKNPLHLFLSVKGLGGDRGRAHAGNRGLSLLPVRAFSGVPSEVLHCPFGQCIQVEQQELGSTLGWRGWSGSGRRVQGGALGAGAHPEPGPRAARERAQGCVPCGGSVRECGHAAVCEQGTCAPRVPKCHRIQKDGSKPREG